MPLRFSFKKTKNKYTEEITRQHEDGNFLHMVKTTYFTNKHSKEVKQCFPF